MKLSIEVVGFKRFERGTLVGFADVVIRELRLKVHEVAVHQKNGSRWASMPSRPWLRDGIAGCVYRKPHPIVMPRWNRLSWRDDRAVPLCSMHPGLAIQVEVAA